MLAAGKDVQEVCRTPAGVGQPLDNALALLTEPSVERCL